MRRHTYVELDCGAVAVPTDQNEVMPEDDVTTVRLLVVLDLSTRGSRSPFQQATLTRVTNRTLPQTHSKTTISQTAD